MTLLLVPTGSILPGSSWDGPASKQRPKGSKPQPVNFPHLLNLAPAQEPFVDPGPGWAHAGVIGLTELPRKAACIANFIPDCRVILQIHRVAWATDLLFGVQRFRLCRGIKIESSQVRIIPWGFEAPYTTHRLQSGAVFVESGSNDLHKESALGESSGRCRV